MKIKEIATAKPAPNDATAIEADAIKRQQQKLAGRSAQLKIQTTQKKLAQQSAKARELQKPAIKLN